MRADYLGAWSLEGPDMIVGQDGFGGPGPVTISAPSVLSVFSTLENNLQLNDGADVEALGTTNEPCSLTGTIDVTDGATVLPRTTGGSEFEPGVLSIGNAPNDVSGGQGSTIQLNAHNATFGPGLITLPFANDYAGSWQITQGVLKIEDANALGTGTTPIVVGPATLRLEHVALARDVMLTAASGRNHPGQSA